MKRRYASNTDVSADRSLEEIRHVLKRYNATSFAMGESQNTLHIVFEMNARRIRFTLPLPDAADKEFQYTPAKRQRRSPQGAQQAYEQAVRQRHRALLLTIKAKLESVESKIETFEEAFMGQLVLPDSRTMYEWAAPQIEQWYLNGGQMPPLLASGS